MAQVVGATMDGQSAPIPRAANPEGFLYPHDVVGTTFFIACNMMLAFTAFFFIQVGVVPQRWRTSVSVAGLVTGVAWYNYTFMKDQWVKQGISPTTYRYTDWLVTVPLQITEFYFILSAAGRIPSSLGLRLFIASIVMVGFGWTAEVDILDKTSGFVGGCACWLYIVYETFAGEASQYAEQLKSAASQSAFNTLRLIVTIGWCIYPIGYAQCWLLNHGDPRGPPYETLNVLYNIADLVNKGAFGLCVWSAANIEKEGALLG
jgi:bacteriorhodopsin